MNRSYLTLTALLIGLVTAFTPVPAHADTQWPAPVFPNAIPVGSTSTVTFTGSSDITYTLASKPAGLDNITVNGSTITVKPLASYSGVLNVPINASNGTSTHFYNIQVGVRPAQTSNASYTLMGGGTAAMMSWAGVIGAHGYNVYVNGKFAAQTGTGINNPIPFLLGPKDKVEVDTFGGDNMQGLGPKTVAVFKPQTNLTSVAYLSFTGTSTTLTATQKATLSSLASAFVTHGYTTVNVTTGTPTISGKTAAQVETIRRNRNTVTVAYLQSRFTTLKTAVTLTTASSQFPDSRTTISIR
jgi:hypothetical protein